MKYIIKTDGGARGNPGPAGIGIVIYDEEGNFLKEISDYVGEVTNNVAEYSALVRAFEELKKIIPKDERPGAELLFFLDSQLIVKQLNNEYQVNEESLFPYFIKVHNFQVKDFQNATFKHVPREENKEADALVNRAIDEKV